MIKLGSTGGRSHFWQPGKVNVNHAQPSVEPTRHAQPASVHRRLAMQSQSTALQLGAQGHWCYRGCPATSPTAQLSTQAGPGLHGKSIVANCQRPRPCSVLSTRTGLGFAGLAWCRCCVNCELQRNGQRAHCHEGSPPPGDSSLKTFGRSPSRPAGHEAYPAKAVLR